MTTPPDHDPRDQEALIPWLCLTIAIALALLAWTALSALAWLVWSFL